MAERDQEDLDNIAKAFGLVVIQWGNSEQSLDMLVALLWQSFPTREFAKRIPVMLSLKLKFLRKSFASVKTLKPLQTDAEVVFSEFDRLSQMRHDLIHGAVASLAPVDGNLVLMKFDVHDDFHHVREVRFPVAAYPKLVGELVDLGRNAGQLTHAVFELVQKLDAVGEK
jgi:hypothetical protein